MDVVVHGKVCKQQVGNLQDIIKNNYTVQNIIGCRPEELIVMESKDYLQSAVYAIRQVTWEDKGKVNTPIC